MSLRQSDYAESSTRRVGRSSTERGSLEPVREACCSAHRDLGGRLRALCAVAQQRWGEVQDRAGAALQHVGQQIASHQRQRRGSLTLLAAVSTRSLAPAFELAFSGLDIKARLAGVPVYTVAKKDNSEFVLVSGEAEEEAQPKQLGLFFFQENDAAAMVAKIQEQNPQLAHESHVTRLTLDKVYDFALAPKENTPAEGVIFRFMPDAKQVRHALQLYKDAGIQGQAFTGVPVFQAEGLTVKTDKKRYTPLFFSKEDLDAAVGNAYTHKEQHREVTNKAHSARADADLQAAQNKYDSAGDGEGKELAREGLDKARAKFDKYKGRVSDQGSASQPPKVEVGCLEEVLIKMSEADGKGDWGSVMFVPAGAISMPSSKKK